MICNAAAMAVTEDELKLVEAVCRRLPPAKGNYLISDFVMNLMATVIDFQTHTTTVERALRHFDKYRGIELSTMDDVQRVLAGYPDDKVGNTALAQYLWGYNMWTRAGMFRGLVRYFDARGVRDQDALRAWATTSEFKRDFEGQKKGLGYAVFNWLVMRQGIETVKPDVHVRRFVEGAVGRTGLSDELIVELVVEGARRIGVKSYELDWAIWESQRALG